MSDRQTKELNSLLRGELAATESYQQALAKVGEDPGADELRRIQVDHREAANTLRQHVHKFGGKPDQRSGVWGTFAKAVAGTAKLLGQTAAMKALLEGEKMGVKDYEAALHKKDLPSECKDFIRMDLLPQTRAHIAALDNLMKPR